MEKQAVQEIMEMGSASVFAEALEGKTVHPVVALPKSYELHNLEKFSLFRNEFRGHMKTTSIEEFVNYHQEFKADGSSKCFIDPEDMSAKTIFDLGDAVSPGHCKNAATAKLKKTSLYTALLHMNERKVDQKTLAEWIEDYAENLSVFTSTGDAVEISTASAAIRSMTFEVRSGKENTVDDFSQHQSEYESMAVRTKQEFPMPAVFKFTCRPYSGLSDRTFEMRMSTIGNEVLLLRIKRLEQHEEQMSEEFQSTLSESFTGKKIDIKTFIGTFSS